MELKALSPEGWLNRQLRVYGEVANLAENLPSDETLLLKELASRANAFEERLGSEDSLSISTVRQSRQLLGSLKKFRHSKIDAKTRASAAMDRFEANNAIANDNAIPRRFLPGMRRVLRDVLRHYGETLGTPRFGPGKVAESVTPIRRWDIITGKSGFRCPDSVGSLVRDAPQTASRLCAVPKDFDKDRLITVEPFENTYVQHTVRGSILEALMKAPDPRLRLFGRDKVQEPWTIDGIKCHTVPELHQGLARVGSEHRTLATLDLSDASDLVSFFQVSQVFPVEVMADLEMGRTEYYSRGDGNRHLWMFGGMGCATTFAVETLMFYAMCHSVADWFRIPFRDRHVTVFGDDIICSTELAEKLVQFDLFNEFGWRLNKTKSYYSRLSAFRESCGAQYFKGSNVTILRYRGFNDSTPETLSSWVDFVELGCRNPSWTELMIEPFETDIPNSTSYSVPGGLLTSNPWWPDTARSIPTRFRHSCQRLQAKVHRLCASKLPVSATGLGPVYGALAGTFAGQTELRKKGHSESVVLLLDSDQVSAQESWLDTMPHCWWWF